MLHFKISVRRFLKVVIFSSAGICVFFGAIPAYGADLLPLQSLDTTESSRVSSPKVLEKGSFQVKGAFERLGHVNAPGPLSSDGKAVRIPNIDRSSVTLGYGVSRSVSLFVGLSGSTEELSRDTRLSLFDDAESGGLSLGNTRSQDLLKGLDSSFYLSGASFAVKVNLRNRAERGGLSVSLMPFVESGVGEKATYALSRSVEPRGGAMLLTSLNAPEKGEIGTQLGIRYRSPESFATVRMRHELFFKVRASIEITGGWSLFGEGEGRHLMLAQRSLDSGESSSYKPIYGGDGRLGVAYGTDSITWTAFGGRRLGPDQGLGFASRTYGASIGFWLGSGGKRKSAESYARQVEQEEQKKARLINHKSSGTSSTQGGDGAYSEMIGAEIDPMDALGSDGAPDFKDVKKIMEEEKRNAAIESEDARIERELLELKAAEEKAKAEDAAKKAVEDKEARRKAREQSLEDDKKFQKWLKEAESELSEIEGFEPSDFEWNGLED